MEVLSRLSELVLGEKKWSSDVETKWSPPEGFFKQSAEKIAKGLMRESDNPGQAMSRLNFYINRAGKNLGRDEKQRLEKAKSLLSANDDASQDDNDQLHEELKLDSKKDIAVLQAFVDKKSAESKKFSTDGKRLDGNWFGGRGIAEWKGDKIVFNDLGSRSAQTVQRKLRKMIPKVNLGESVIWEARSIIVAKRREWTVEGLAPSIKWTKTESYGGSKRAYAELSIAWSKHSEPRITTVAMTVYENGGLWDYYVSWSGIEELPKTGVAETSKEAKDKAVKALIQIMNGKTVLAISNTRNRS